MKSEINKARFEELYLPVHSQFEKYCRALLYNLDDCKDLMGESVCIAYEKFESIRNKDDFRFYLFGIASNLFKKRISRRKAFVQIETVDTEAKVYAFEDPSSEADVGHLYAAIEKLSVHEKEIIALFELSGFKLLEIAEMKEMPLSTVKTHLSRARKNLIKILNPGQEIII